STGTGRTRPGPYRPRPGSQGPPAPPSLPRTGPRLARTRVHPLPDPREQVVLRLLSIHQRPGEVIILGRPGGALGVGRAGEPDAVRVDLRRVRNQRPVTYLEVVTARHQRGDLPRPP